MKLSGMDSTLRHFKGLKGTLIGPLMDPRLPFRVNKSGSFSSDEMTASTNYLESINHRDEVHTERRAH